MADSEKTYTEREIVLRERKAYVLGVQHYAERGFWLPAETSAVKEFPLPSKVVPRVVTDPHEIGIAWRVVGSEGRIVEMQNMGRWGWDHGGRGPTPERVKLWAGLFDNPNVTVPDDGAPA